MSLLQTMLTHLDSPECEPSEQAPQPTENNSSSLESDLFVSTDLETAQFEWAVTSTSDVEYNGKIYRRLEPEYFTWLRSRMLAAQSAFKAGKFPETTWESLKSRFNPLQEYAIQKFGKESLQQTSRQFNPQDYQAPRLQEQTRPSVQKVANALGFGIATVKRTMADRSRGVDFDELENVFRGRPQRALSDSTQAIVRDYIRNANKEGAYITLEMLCQHLEEVLPEQKFSVRTLGRALDRWGFTFGKGVRTQRFKEKDHVIKNTTVSSGAATNRDLLGNSKERNRTQL